MKRIDARVAHLEKLVERIGPKLGCVFASVEDACAAGARGGVLIIGPVMSVEEWNQAAKVQQAQLVHDTKKI